MSKIDVNIDARAYDFKPRVDWILGEEIRPEDMDSLNLGIKKSLQLISDYDVKLGRLSQSMREWEISFPSRFTELDRRMEKYLDEAKKVVDNIKDIDDTGVTQYYKEIVLLDDNTIKLTRGDTTTSTIKLPQNKSSGVLFSKSFGDSRGIELDLDRGTFTLNSGLNAQKLLEYTGDRLTLTGAEFREVDSLEVNQLKINKEVELAEADLKLNGNLDVLGATTLNGKLVSKDSHLLKADVDELFIKGIPIYPSKKEHERILVLEDEFEGVKSSQLRLQSAFDKLLTLDDEKWEKLDTLLSSAEEIPYYTTTDYVDKSISDLQLEIQEIIDSKDGAIKSNTDRLIEHKNLIDTNTINLEKKADKTYVDEKLLNKGEVWKFTGHTNLVCGVAVDDNGYVYSGSDDITVRKIDPDGNEVWQFTGHTSAVYSVAADSQGYVYSGSTDKTVRKISPDGQEVWKFTGHTGTVRSVAVDDKGYVYSASNDKTVRKIDPDGNEMWNFTGHTDSVRSVAVDSQGYVYSASNDKTVRKIDPDGNEMWKFEGYTNTAWGVVVDSQGYVYSGGFDKTVRKIDPNGNEVWKFTGHTNLVCGVAVDDNGYVYSVSYDKTVRKIDPDGNEVWQFNGHTDWVCGVAVDDNGYVYSCSYDKTVRKISPDDNVSSVNGKMGEVQLYSSDIEIDETTSTTISTKLTALQSSIDTKANTTDLVNYAKISQLDELKAELLLAIEQGSAEAIKVYADIFSLGNSDASDIILNTGKIGLVLQNVTQSELNIWAELTTMEDVANSEEAMNAVANSTTAWNAVMNSTTAFNEVINSTTAFNEVINSTTAFNTVMNSTTAWSTVINSTTAMSAVANSTTAFNTVMNSTTAWSTVINSTTAMNAVANSTTAMNAVANSTTAMNAVANSTTALKAIADSDKAMMTLINHSKTQTHTGSKVKSINGIVLSSDVYKVGEFSFADGTKTSYSDTHYKLSNGHYNVLKSYPKRAVSVAGMHSDAKVKYYPLD